MPAVGEPAGEVLVAHPVSELLPNDHRAERDVAGVDALGDGEDVGDDVPVLASEPLAGASEPRHDLVADQEDAVAVAHLSDRLQVALRRDDNPVRPDYRLEDDRGHLVGALVLEQLLEMRAAAADRARVGVTGRTAVRIRVEHADNTGDPGLGVPAARVAGQRDRPRRRAVVGAIAGDDLVSPRVPARQLDRVLVRLGAAVREEGHGQVAWRHLGEQAAELRA
jgi:hypothetical protein